MPGPLHGTTILELAGIGPGPFAGMMLADMGAEVIRIDRPGGAPMAELGHDVLLRSRRRLAVDLKSPEGVELVLALCTEADAIFEGWRPGVAERLGVGPHDCMTRNRRLVYGRMTGWGQDGPLAGRAGHDLNYLALSGALFHSGRAGAPPTPAMNLTADFGGGGMLLAFGLVCALWEAQTSGRGQVVDAAMIDGSAALMAMWFSLQAQGRVRPQRGTNLLDTGAPFYDVHQTADGKWLALAALEPAFYARLRERLELHDEVFDTPMDPAGWPQMRERIAAVIGTRTRDEWEQLLAGEDVCVAPVLSMSEAPTHPHHASRATYLDVDGVVQGAPAPRFSRTQAATPRPVGAPGADTRAVLTEHGVAPDEIDRLVARGVVADDR